MVLSKKTDEQTVTKDDVDKVYGKIVDFMGSTLDEAAQDYSLYGPVDPTKKMPESYKILTKVDRIMEKLYSLEETGTEGAQRRMLYNQLVVVLNECKNDEQFKKKALTLDQLKGKSTNPHYPPGIRPFVEQANTLGAQQVTEQQAIVAGAGQPISETVVKQPVSDSKDLASIEEQIIETKSDIRILENLLQQREQRLEDYRRWHAENPESSTYANWVATGEKLVKEDIEEIKGLKERLTGLEKKVKATLDPAPVMPSAGQVYSTEGGPSDGPAAGASVPPGSRNGSRRR